MATSTTPADSSPVPPLVVSVDLPRARVRVAGELDRDSAHHLLDALTVLDEVPARRWQLDVRGVTFCDAGGLRALTHAHRLAADSGRVLHLGRTSRPIARLVGLVGYEQLFPVPVPPSARAVRHCDHDGPPVSPARAVRRGRGAPYVGCGTTKTA